MTILISVFINLLAIYIIFQYFKWKLTSYTFLDRYDKKKEEIRKEIDLILLELNRTTERNLQILEAKIGQLNDAIHKSEKIFTILKKEKEVLDNTGNIYQRLERKSMSDAVEKIGRKAESEKKEETPGDMGLKKDEIREKVITMYKNGIDIDLISRNLGITSGEVELIISISNIK